ncbi:MAG: SPFH domain-containing protein [Lachnospiraceae bacterium]|nr:SPFH domain-containing protein [Lachnospiraceae bacterium]
MALFHSDSEKEKQHKGILGAFAVDVIKWEPESSQEAGIIVHKFEYEDFPNGSYLIVGPSQMAVFTNNMSAESSADENGMGAAQCSVFHGPCKIKLETGNSRFAPFRNISNSLTGGESAFHSTVYFVNTTYMNELSWGTQAPVVVMDPEEEINVHVRAFGMFGVHIEKDDPEIAELQARRFLNKVVGTRADYTRSELLQFMRARILEYVPDLLAKSMIEKNIGILKISAHLSEFSELIYDKLFEHFDDFGLTLDNFSFHNINAPDEDLRAINEMKIQRKRDQLEAEGAARKMDIESAARARMREREGYTYQQEKAFEVLGEAASNEGVSSTLMGAGMGLGMGVGVGGSIGAGMGAVAREAFGSMGMNEAAATAEEQLCPDCGAKLPKGAKFCLNCGGAIRRGAVCPDCGQEIISGAKFCPNCGRQLAAAHCPNCGVKLVPGSKFCAECGMKI